VPSSSFASPCPCQPFQGDIIRSSAFVCLLSFVLGHQLSQRLHGTRHLARKSLSTFASRILIVLHGLAPSRQLLLLGCLGRRNPANFLL
jgi:hypothetical protein